MLLMKSSAACQKACLLATLASLNNDHNSNLRARYAGVGFLCRPSFVPARHLPLQSATIRFSFIANLSNTTPLRAPVVELEARVTVDRCCVAVTTSARSLIWPCNNSVLSHCTSFFSISPSLASKLMRGRLSLRSSCLGASARVSIVWLTTWRTFLAIIVVHLGCFVDVVLAVTSLIASHSINCFIARLLSVARNIMFLMATFILDNRISTNELLLSTPMTSQCLMTVAW